MLNSALEEIDFTFVGRLLVRGVTAGLDFLLGLLGSLNWKLIGRSIGDFMKGAFNESQEWISSYDWSKMASSLYKNLKEFSTGIDFAGVATSFFKLLGSAFGAAASFIGTFFKDVWTDIKTYFTEKIEECGGSIPAGLWKGIKDAFFNVGKWIKENILDPFVEGFKQCFGIHSPSTVMAALGWDIVAGLWQGIKDKISGGIALIKGWAGDVVEWFIKGKDGKGIVENFKETAANIVNSFKDKIGSTYSSIKNNMVTWATNVKDWFENTSFGGVNANTFSTFANNTIEGFKNKIGSAYTNVKSNVTTWADKTKEWFTSSSFGGVNTETFSTFANNTIEGFKNKIGSAYTNTKSNITTWASNVKDWFTNSSFGGVNSENFATYANNAINGFKDKIGSSYTNAKSNITTWATSVKTWFTDVASSSTFSGFATSIIDGFKNRIGEYYATVKTNMSAWANDVKSTFEGSGNTSLSNVFKGIAKNVVDGFSGGIISFFQSSIDTVKGWATSLISAIKTILGIKSPSRVFNDIAFFTIEGFNTGITEYGDTTKDIISSWADSFVNITPAMALAVDTSALKYYDSDSFAKTVSASITANNRSTVDFSGNLKEAVLEALNDSRLADDMRRQADKEEQTVLQVDGRRIAETVVTQQYRNGFRFVTA